MSNLKKVVKKLKEWGQEVDIVENKKSVLVMNNKKFEDLQKIFDKLKQEIKILEGK